LLLIKEKVMNFNAHSRGHRNALLAARIDNNNIDNNNANNTNNDSKRQLHRSISWPAR